jgi:hypothetical protein
MLSATLAISVHDSSLAKSAEIVSDGSLQAIDSVREPHGMSIASSPSDAAMPVLDELLDAVKMAINIWRIKGVERRRSHEGHSGFRLRCG